jgi:hypothetical protein
MVTVPFANKRLMIGTGLLILAAAVLAFSTHQARPAASHGQIRDDGGEVLNVVGTTDSNLGSVPANAQVTVNGQPVPLDPSGSATVNTPGGQAKVNVSGGTTSVNSHTTQTSSPDGSINISVSSNNSNSAGSSSTTYQNSSSTWSNSSSSVNAFSNGSGGRVNITTSP